jgi:hypothetical protein
MVAIADRSAGQRVSQPDRCHAIAVQRLRSAPKCQAGGRYVTVRPRG